MKRLLTLLFFALLLAGVLLVAAPAGATECYPTPGGVYVCDARPVLPAFSTPHYASESILFTTTYAWIEDYAPLYAEPNFGAEIVDQETEGILYTTVDAITTDAEGNTWYQIRGKWASADSIHVVEESKFSGVIVNVQPERPFGWVLYGYQPRSVPDAEPAESDPWVSRYTFVQVYGVAQGADDWIWYDIGGGRWIKQNYVALVDASPRPEGVGARDFWVEVDLYGQVFAAYEGDRMVYAGLVSSGLDRFPTNEGLFTVWGRDLEVLMYGGEVGDDYYYLEDVPHTMFFDKEIALHGAYWHDDFGQKRSHGCVNMPPRDAEWVYYWSANAPGDLWVWVHSREQDYYLQQYGAALQAAAAPPTFAYAGR